MKKIVLLTSLTVVLATLFMLSPKNTKATSSIVWDKEAVDCGSYFGTKCTGNGDGCDPKECDAKPSLN